MAKNSFDIFISYSRKDFDEVNAFVNIIKQRIPNIKYWFDVNGIESGDDFEDKIISAIDQSSYILFALSNNSIESKRTKEEVMYATNTGKKVIPVLLKGAELKGWFLFKFGLVDYIDSIDSMQVEKLIRNLAEWTQKEILPNKIKSQSKAKAERKRLLEIPDNDIYAYVENDKCGFKVISTDEIIVQPIYDVRYGILNSCGKVFSEGLANVSINGKWGYIDKTGKKVIPLIYDDANNFCDGLARIRLNGKYGFIDKLGRKLIPPKYDEANDFSNGYTKVKKDGEWITFDKNGKRTE